MKTKTVTVHYCEFCRKRRFMRPAMVKHEAACTANPNRVCRMCQMAGLAQRPIGEIVKLIQQFDYNPADDEGREASFAVREFVGNCPACILAGSRQSKHGVPFHFDWKDESKNWLGEHSDNTRPGYSLP